MRVRLLGDTPRTYAVIFDAGDEVMEGLQEFARDHDADASSFTAVGGFESATLAYFDVAAKQYQDIPVPEQVEVLSLTGDITRSDGGRQVHAHAIVGRYDGTTRGGHVKRGLVRPTLEVIVTESPRHLRRRHDERFGLTLIDLPADG